ncbi:hypothetical protein [Solibacillus sp. FSL K6-1126]|uniref:hypothetical protein n=1 Tax=Solibacillus sp. FSL K6-1126 TaxID=2921463 RepID=UPI0030F902E0
MAVEDTKEVQDFLEGFKGHNFNTKIRKFYKEADKISKEIICSPSSLDKEVIEHAVNKYNQRGSIFTKEEFVLMELKSKVLYFSFGLHRFYGKYGWKDFNSPTEVLAGTIPLIGAKWNHRLVSFNVYDSTKKYEVDQSWKDLYGNSVFLLDIQGKLPHNGKEVLDKKKYEYFNEYTKYLQINGKTVARNYVGVFFLILKLISESYSSVNIPYIRSFIK